MRKLNIRMDDMEITKYLCEFFFTDFWHWLGLWFIIGTIFYGELIKIGKFNNKERKMILQGINFYYINVCKQNMKHSG